MAGKCPICGETDPLPASMCLAILTGCAVRGEPCQDSVEGQARTRAAMIEQSARLFAEITADRDATDPLPTAPTPTTPIQED